MKQIIIFSLLVFSSIASARDVTISLYFTDREVAVESDCAATLVSRRSYSVSSLTPELVLLELLSGPSANDILGGAADSFAPLAGSDNADSRLVKYLIRTEQRGRQFILHFEQPALAWFSNGSCGATSVMSPIQTTLTQLKGIDNVDIYIDGQRLQDVMG